MKKVTLQDIANELGISKGTVDRAIHNRPDISLETREKVLKLVEKYNYKPDKIARSLSLKSKKIKIGVILQKEPAFFWDNVINGAKAAESELSDFGLQVSFSLLENGRQCGDTLQKLDELIDSGVNAIAIVPANSGEIINKINHISEKGIPVATLNDDIKDSKRIFYVGPQVRQSGRIAGELMGRFLKGEGRVLTLNGDLNSLEYRERLEGFEEVLKEKFSKVSIAANYTYNVDVKSFGSIDIIRSILENTDDIDGIYDVDGATLHYIGEIVKSIPKHKKTIVIGHEIWGRVMELIEEGVITAAISQDPYSQGYFVIKMLYEYIAEGKLPEFDRMYTRLDIILKENLITQNNIINPYFVKM